RPPISTLFPYTTLFRSSRFREMTLARFDTRRGHYSTIGHRTVVKNSDTLKDVRIGTDAYIKGVNKLKNVTVNSIAGAYTQIGERSEEHTSELQSRENLV